MSHTAELPAQRDSAIEPRRAEGIQVTWDQVEAYLASMEDRGCSPGTIDSYRRSLIQFFHALPPDRSISRDTIANWRNGLLEKGYRPRSVNLRLSTANGFLGFLGLREFQAPEHIVLEEDSVQPELTRNEYLRLLSAARALGKRRTYLLVKVLAALGLCLHELPQLTVEAIWNGTLIVTTNSAQRIIHIPACLQAELASYAQSACVSRGAVFVTRNGTMLSRTAVTSCIQRLAGDARVAPEKCNPRCLRRLYQTTQEGIQANIALLAEQTYARLLEQEQLTIGWKEVTGP